MIEHIYGGDVGEDVTPHVEVTAGLASASGVVPVAPELAAEEDKDPSHGVD